MTPAPEVASYRGGAAIWIALVVGVVALIACLFGFWIDPTRVLFAWLIALVYVLTVVIGLMGMLIITYTINAGWPTVVRRLAEAGMPVMPLLGLLFIPILLGLGHLYPWMHVAAFQDPAIHKVLVHKAAYLNPTFFVLRSVFYLALWSAFALLLWRWSVATDEAPHPDLRRRLRVLAAAMAPIMGLTLTGAGTDWIMSLAPEWVSYIFGYYFMSLALLGGIAALTVAAYWNERRGRVPVSLSHYYALGRVLFTFLVLWGYTAYFNYFITWIANKPSEVRWFVLRSVGPFRAMSLFTIFGHFGVPFVVLITYVVKRTRGLLAFMAAYLLIAQYLEVHWLIAPERNPTTVFDWWDAVALLAVAGLSLAVALWAQRGRLLAPAFDPRFAEAVRYESW